MRRILSIAVLGIVLTSACVSTKPDTPESRNQQASLELARQMVGQGEYQRAVQFLSPRSRSEDAPAEVHMLLGLAFIGLNNPDAAMRSFTNVLKIDASNDDARLNLGYTYVLLGKQAQARNLLSAILKGGKYQFPERVHLNIGLSYLQEKKCDKAIEEFRSALDVDPTYSAAYFNTGKCQVISGRLRDAQASFQRSVDFCPGCTDPQLELAAVTHKLGDRKKALSQLDLILKAKPDAETEKRVLALRRQIVK